MNEPDENEELVKKLAVAVWDDIIHFKASEERVAAAIREAYRKGWHQGYRDAPGDSW